MAAQVGVEPVSDPTGAKPRRSILGVEVDFPTPIILGDTGLGIFGLFGLFAMHYMRNLPRSSPGNAVGPDLQWLIDSGGQPQFCSIQAAEPELPVLIHAELGEPGLFGIGALLGTVDGFLLNMRGMFVLSCRGRRSSSPST